MTNNKENSAIEKPSFFDRAANAMAEFVAENPNITRVASTVVGAVIGGITAGPLGALAGAGTGLAAGQKFVTVAKERVEEIKSAEIADRDADSHSLSEEKTKNRSHEQEISNDKASVVQTHAHHVEDLKKEQSSPHKKEGITPTNHVEYVKTVHPHQEQGR